MKDFETYTETRPVVLAVPTNEVGTPPEVREQHTQEVVDVLEWYIHHDPEGAIALGGLGRIVAKVSQDVHWPRADVYAALRHVPNVDYNLADSSVRILETVKKGN